MFLIVISPFFLRTNKPHQTVGKGLFTRTGSRLTYFVYITSHYICYVVSTGFELQKVALFTIKQGVYHNVEKLIETL
jgi:hypothetical protein